VATESAADGVRAQDGGCGNGRGDHGRSRSPRYSSPAQPDVTSVRTPYEDIRTQGAYMTTSRRRAQPSQALRSTVCSTVITP
ncbi:Hypothetical predicted protein, partial [Pelobates cultripes]